MIRLAAFLGNPGSQHSGNRHNAAWHLAQALPFYDSLSWQKKFKGRCAAPDRAQVLSALAALPGEAEAGAGAATGKRETAKSSGKQPEREAAEPIPGESPDFTGCHFLMPDTFMNLSGESVFQAASFYKIKPEEILVVHDELEIPLGTISLKFSGGLGGHNGLRSVKACFGSADFWRLRIGIGRPGHDDIYNWVLSDFTAEETETVKAALASGAFLLLRCLTGKPESLLGEWAKKKITMDLKGPPTTANQQGSCG